MEKSDIDKSNIAHAYGEIPASDFMPAKYHRRCLAMVEPYLSPGARVADLGCSYGSLTELLAQSPLQLEVHGCDLAPALVDAASLRVPSARLQVADMTALPYADDFFDSAFLIEVMEHLDQPVTALSEIKRVLKPGSYCLITMPNRDWFHFKSYDAKRRRFQPVDDHFYSVREAEDLIRSSGLSILRVRGGENLYFGGGLPRLLEQVALALYPPLHRRMKRMMLLVRKPE